MNYLLVKTRSLRAADGSRGPAPFRRSLRTQEKPHSAIIPASVIFFTVQKYTLYIFYANKKLSFFNKPLPTTLRRFRTPLTTVRDTLPERRKAAPQTPPKIVPEDIPESEKQNTGSQKRTVGKPAPQQQNALFRSRAPFRKEAVVFAHASRRSSFHSFPSSNLADAGRSARKNRKTGCRCAPDRQSRQ
ncbi:hypothetical protein [uncultured Alistipes sp.]|uniref:hypothetical protein n=1 Tax=uncultured Alistipes sp. TaxID=538949 RepID=UPI00272D168A|nr:hypothetical protein [uncultured Alistipes sp.]